MRERLPHFPLFFLPANSRIRGINCTTVYIIVQTKINVSLTGIGRCLPVFFIRFTPEQAPPSNINGVHAGDMYVTYGINN